MPNAPSPCSRKPTDWNPKLVSSPTRLPPYNEDWATSPEAQAWLERNPGNRLAPTIDDPFLLEVARLSRTPRFFRMAGDWALARGDAPAAIEAYRNAVTLAPQDTALRERLASALAENVP